MAEALHGGRKTAWLQPQDGGIGQFIMKKRHSRHGINFFDYLCPYKYNYLKT